jgi:hypothetical protein
MVNGKPRLSIHEIKQLIDQLKQYGTYHSMTFGNWSYNIDDIYEQYLYNLDALMGIMDEVILRKGR